VSQLLGTLPPLNTQRQSEGYNLQPPPGFPGSMVPPPGVAPGHQNNPFAGGLTGWGSSTVAQATSFFKHLLPGVNVTVAATATRAGGPVSGEPYGAAAAANGPTAAAANGNGAGFPAFMGGPAAPAAGAGAGQAPNPGAVLLQQLRRGQQQQQHLS
jgi:hypothetical protein